MAETAAHGVVSAMTTQPAGEPLSSGKPPVQGPASTSQWVYDALESNQIFAQNVLYPLLNEKLIPNKDQINDINNIVCKHALKKYGFYPSTEIKHRIALDIIDRFPQLQKLAMPDTPPESAFFHMNGGKGAGHPHKGKVFKFFRNAANNLPKDKKKFPRCAKPVHSIDEDIVKANAKCSTRLANNDNFELIRDTMITTHLMLENCLIQKRSVGDIFALFPHLKSYDGILIQDSFERLMKDTFNKYNKLKKLLARGNLTKPSTMFDDVESGTLRGCLNIMQQLNFRGIKRTHKSEGNLVQNFARPLIRWIENSDDSLKIVLSEYNASRTLTKIYPPAHLICKGEPLKKGHYYIYIENEIISVKKSVHEALDVFFKLFSVTGSQVPTELRKLYDFVLIAAYNVLNTSDKANVNKLVELFTTTADAEESD